MKTLKKLLIAFMLLLTFTLVACDNAVTEDLNDNSNYVLQEDFDNAMDKLELENAYLHEIIDSMNEAMKANGMIISYEAFLNDNDLAESEIMGTNFDTDLAPTYMQDESGEYITFRELALMLKAKYFGDVNADSYDGASDTYAMIPYAAMTFTFTDYDITVNEVIARLILLIEELAKYDYYALSSNGIILNILYSDGTHSHTVNFSIPKVIVTNGIFTINYDSLIGNEFESYITAQETIDRFAIETFYNDFVTNGTYDGYVLNYVG